jgi:hypothetical protein
MAKSVGEYVAILSMFAVGLHGIVSAYVHVFTEFNWIPNTSPEFYWALAALGNKQAFIALIDFAVAFDIFETRHLLSPLLALHVAMVVIYSISTQLNGRHIHLISTTTPGRYAPFILTAVCALGIYANSRKVPEKQKKSK